MELFIPNFVKFDFFDVINFPPSFFYDIVRGKNIISELNTEI